MKFRVLQHIDSYIEVVVEADDEAKASELGEEKLTNMDATKFSQQVIANAQAGETWVADESRSIPG